MTRRIVLTTPLSRRKQVYTLDALLAEAQSTEHTRAEDHSESESKAAVSKADEGDVGESHDFAALEQVLSFSFCPLSLSLSLTRMYFDQTSDVTTGDQVWWRY